MHGGPVWWVPPHGGLCRCTASLSVPVYSTHYSKDVSRPTSAHATRATTHVSRILSLSAARVVCVSLLHMHLNSKRHLLYSAATTYSKTVVRLLGTHAHSRISGVDLVEPQTMSGCAAPHVTYIIKKPTSLTSGTWGSWISFG